MGGTTCLSELHTINHKVPMNSGVARVASLGGGRHGQGNGKDRGVVRMRGARKGEEPGG